MRIALRSLVILLVVAVCQPLQASTDELLVRGLAALRDEDYHGALRQLQALVDIEDRPDGNRRAVVGALIGIAEARLVMGQLSDAGNTARRALQLATDLEAPPDELLANALRIVGDIELEYARIPLAIESCSRAVTILQEARAGSVEPLAKALRCAGLAAVYWNEYRRGLQLLRRAVNLADESQPPNPSLRVSARLALFSSLRVPQGSQPYTDEQRRLMIDADGICQTDITVPSQCRLQIWALAIEHTIEQRQFSQAQTLIEAAERIVQRQFGLEHRVFADAVAARAAMAAMDENCAMALRDGQRATQMYERIFGLNNFSSLSTRGIMGYCLHRLGRNAEAAAIQREVIRLARQWLPPISTSLDLYLSQYADTLAALGRIQESRRVRREAAQMATAFEQYLREQTTAPVPGAGVR